MAESITTRNSDYSYKVKRVMSEEERQVLAEKHVPKLLELGNRYLPNFDFSNGIPLRSELIDVVRASWLLDKNLDRPSYDDIVSGTGYLFGRLLEDHFGMQWCVVEDSSGEFISLLKFHDPPLNNNEEVSIPPFSYVEKRKDLQNAEVFQDGMTEFAKLFTAE